jgi:hypothetical protein
MIHVVCGADTAEAGAFTVRTVHDGIDLEYDGCSELFITVRYRRFTYTANSISNPADCDPLLFALICRHDPYVDIANSIHNNTMLLADEDGDEAGSEFEDCDGCLYRVVHGMATTVGSSTCIQSKCVYPQRNNPLFGTEKSFDVQMAKDFIERRLNG